MLTNNILYNDIDDVFDLFPTDKWKDDDDFFYNFIGGKVRKAHWKKFRQGKIINRPAFDAGLSTNKSPRYACSEDYFEWVDLLTALRDAENQFNFLKLGAHTGRWEAFSAVANHSYKRLPCHIISVEPISYMIRHTFDDNGIFEFEEKINHEVVSAWVANTTRMHRDKKISKLISISDLILKFNGQPIDLIDCDCQGRECSIFHGARESLNKFVKRVHIGTHGTFVDKIIYQLFESMGWNNIYNFGWGKEVDLPQGKIIFQDGIQTWVNLSI
jgi:hypothetical protein